jgi:hypothetical protein
MDRKRVDHRRFRRISGGTRFVALAAAAILLVLPSADAAAAQFDLSGVRVVAIAPFDDQAALSRPVADYGAARLGELLKRSAVQTVDASRVAEEMRRLGIGTRDLISPSRATALGTQVGADVIITGRVTQLFTESYDIGIRDRRGGGPITSRVDVDIRLIDVSSRVNVFQDTFICDVLGLPATAMDCAMRDVAARLVGRH